jgi:hypothetical protein
MMTKEEGKAFFLNFAMDISPNCDCYGWSDTPIVNGLGILASYDPVAVDKACIDMMNAAPGLLNSEAEEFGALATGAKKLHLIKGKDIEAQIQGGVTNGIGSAEYEIEAVSVDRSRVAIDAIYPNGVRAKKLKTMYANNHPLKGLDTASFGRPTEGAADPRHPKK